MREYRGQALIIDDDPAVCAVYGEALTSANFRVTTGHTLSDLHDLVQSKSFEVILLDIGLGTESGLDALPFVLKNAPFSACFMLTADESVDRAVDCMRRGATGYLTKSMPIEGVVDKILTQIPERREIQGFDPRMAGTMIGDSRAIRETLETIERIRDVDSTVLILGESGSGKEVVARLIHQNSPRSKQRFEAVNCAAIPATLLETELFGHERGAFTDAKTARKGIFEACTDGTLLLDEIGDMPMSLQTKLLRVLQERQVLPIGADSPVDVDTRVIAATHRNIQEEVESNRFREDLFFRLSVVTVTVPPLRRRVEDIPLLIEHFLEKYNRRFDRQVASLDPSSMRRLQVYDWPGNVRELQNSVERGVVLSRDGRLHLEDMFQHIGRNNATNRNGMRDVTSEAFRLSLTEAKQLFERAYLENLLRATHGNVSEVARIAGRYRADVYRIMARYDLNFDEFREESHSLVGNG